MTKCELVPQTGIRSMRRLNRGRPPVEIEVPSDSGIFQRPMQAHLQLARPQSRRDGIPKRATQLRLVSGTPSAGDDGLLPGAFSLSPEDVA